MAPCAVLVGPPGAGKTVVGAALAQLLGVAFRDTDKDVEQQVGATVAEIFVDSGEAHFRQLEREAVRRALAEHEGVLSLGGGAVVDPDTRAALADHPVAFLDVGLADAAKRVGLNRDRPLLLGNPRAQLKKLMDERRPVYEAVARVTVLTDGISPRDAARAVADGLGLAADGAER